FRNWRWVTTGLVFVEQLHAGRFLQQRLHFFHRDLLAGFDVHCFGVRVEHWYAYTGGVHQDLWVFQNLLGFPNHLHLFLGVAVVLEHVDLRDHVEGDLLRIDADLWLAAVQQLRGLGGQLVDGFLTSARYALVGGHVDAG